MREDGAPCPRRDVDAYDAICDHLLVIDHDAPRRPFRTSKPKVVGTYRLLRQEVAERHGGFYTRGRIRHRALIVDRHPDLRFLELGRSCVLKPYRNKRTVELLWHGIWTYVLHHRIDVMIGCASLEGTDPAKLALPLSFLHHLCPRTRALACTRAAGASCRDGPPRQGGRRSQGRAPRLPPLIKGYLAPRRQLRRRAPSSTASSAPPTCSSCCRSARSTRAISSISASRANRHAA